MPIKKKNNGVITWEPPTQAKIDNFISSLLVEKKVIELPSSMKSQIDSFMSTTLQGSKRLVNSNKKRITSFNSLLEKGIGPVDIVVPIYGNLHVVRQCIESVFSRTKWPFNLILVDDCSPDKATSVYLEQIAQKDNVTLLANKKNKGFAATVNKGIVNGAGEYICVLNSDVIVTPNWLTKLVLALEADPKNKIVNPITNNTALISVPMQEGVSYLEMNKGLELTSSQAYPEIMPTGFCFMFKRELVNTVGLFNEGFESYGEETDFWMRTMSYVDAGEYKKWKAVLADDTYLFHERGTSFSSLGSEKHMSKRQAGSSRFHALWPTFKQWNKSFDIGKVMAPYKSPLPDDLVKVEYSPYNIAFIVYSTGFCGGMKFIADIVNQYIERGINAKVVLIKRPNQGNTINVLEDLHISPIVFNSEEEFIKDFTTRVFRKGVVVASTCEMVDPVVEVCKQEKTKLRSILFAQSDDPELAPDNLIDKMKEAYKKFDFIFPASSWLDEKIRTVYKQKTIGYIRPGVETDLFHKRDRELGDERPTVLFSLLDTYPYKGYKRGVAVATELERVCLKNNKQIRIMAYGTMNVPECKNLIGLGLIPQSQLANLLGTEIDIFCDPSSIHSYGMPALEALVSGVVPVLWDNGGIHEYADDSNAVIFEPTTKPGEVAAKIYKLFFETPQEFIDLKKAKRPNQSRKEAVNYFIKTLENKLSLRIKPKKINIVTPHLRKHGGPTTILNIANNLWERGHNVQLYTVYPDVNPEITDQSKVPIKINWKSPDRCDVLITNSDNDKNGFFSSLETAKKKILLKLSHNPRFKILEEAGLKYDWDAIVTSTNWLTEVCKNPTEGWDYPSREATRIGWFHYGHYNFVCPSTARKYGDLSSKMRIAFLAHHHPLKGTEEALKALQAIKQKYRERVEIIAVGEWPDFTKMKPDWVGYLSVPNRNQLAAFLKETDIWVTASHTEGLGRMALEAMSSSVAVCLSDTGAEFAKPGKNCLVHHPKNVPQLVKNIDNLINDQNLLRTIAENGFETAIEFSDPSSCIENLERVIENVCNQ